MKLSTRSLPTAPAVHAGNENKNKAISCTDIRLLDAAGKIKHRKCSIFQRRHSYPNIKPSQTTEFNQSTSAPSLLPSRRISIASPDHINDYHSATDRANNPASDSLPSSISSSHPLKSQNNDNDIESNLLSCSIGSPLLTESPRRKTISTQVSPFSPRPQTDSTPSGSVFSLIGSVYDPAALESDTPISNAEFIKVVASRLVCAAGSGTISADFMTYLGFPAAAFGSIVAMGAVGLFDGLYTCGEKLEKECDSFEVHNLLYYTSHFVYRTARLLTQHLPDSLCFSARKSYIYGSVAGAASTVFADIFGHAHAANLLTQPWIITKFCPIIVAAGTTVGVAAGLFRSCQTSPPQRLLIENDENSLA